MSPKNERADRLAAALRDNLKKRKAQARAVATGAEPEAPPVSADDAPSRAPQ